MSVDVNGFIKSQLKQAVPHKRLAIAPFTDEKLEKKLDNAIASYKLDLDPNLVVALFDMTVFNNGKDGFLVTGESLYVKGPFEVAQCIKFESMHSAEYVQKTVTKKDKTKEIEYLLITYGDDEELMIDWSDLKGHYQGLAGFLTQLISEFEDFEEQEQVVLLSDMSETVKAAYCKVAINLAFANDNEIDAKETAEILSLITRVELNPEKRLDVRSYMLDHQNTISADELLSTIKAEISDTQYEALCLTLMKDLIGIFAFGGQGTVDEAKTSSYLQELKTKLGISDEKLDVMVEAVKNDQLILDDHIDDSMLEQKTKQLAQSVAAVGAPIAAVYMSGSVMGLSAAGLTSGLSALGVGGVLGFSSMVTGIGAAVLIGVGAYHGMKKFTGADKLDKHKHRAFLLTKAVQHTQKTISVLMEDINFVTEKMNELISKSLNQNEVIHKLAAKQQQLTMLIKSGKHLENKSNEYQASELRSKCPIELDKASFLELTSEPSKKKLQESVLSHYECEKGAEEGVLTLKQGISVKTLEQLAQIFEAIGYFDMSNMLGAKSKALGKAALGKLLS
ncbi:hypothetical protein ACED56_15690 [Vibrio splendidus]|uniref:hypothetical protein n=1 Tax=Vibrio splendidus TaxID=29497 RepID=UPI00352C7F73